MFTVARLIELFTVHKHVTASKPHVLSAVASLAGIVFLGVFGAFFAAAVLAASLWVLFSQLLLDGASLTVAALVAAGAGVFVLAVAVIAALILWSRVRADVDAVLDMRAPVLGPVVDGAAGIAGSFIKGLRKKKAE